MSERPPVLMIGIDASAASLIGVMRDAGELPALRSLHERGTSGLLSSDGRRFVGGVWPTVYTSSRPPWHGIYHNKLWRQERQRCEMPDEVWLPAVPFWRRPALHSLRTAVIDVPMTIELPKSSRGVELMGWGTHDLIAKGSWPRELWSETRRRYGPPEIRPEMFGPQTPRTLQRLREELLRSTRQMTGICEGLVDRGPWDLFLVVLGATHRAGHYLWDLSQVDEGAMTPELRTRLGGALREIHRACDAAVGRLVARFPPDTRVLVFSAHGMGPNLGWSDRCPEILARIQRTPPKSGLLYSIKRRLPWSLLRQVTTRMPDAFTRWAVTAWSARMFDWSSTRYFPLPMDHAGYLRVNLAGREPRGIVKPGSEYDRICRELTDAFLGFRDLDSGERIVDEVLRVDDLAPATAPYRDRLPDLVVTWREVRPGRGIVSDELGELLWSSAWLPSGRSGNHGDGGWMVAAGPGVPSGLGLEGHDVIDLVPTVCRWLEVEDDPSFQGRPIPELSARHRS